MLSTLPLAVICVFTFLVSSIGAKMAMESAVNILSHFISRRVRHVRLGALGMRT